MEKSRSIGTKLVRATSAVLLVIMVFSTGWHIFSIRRQTEKELLEQARVLAAQVLAVRKVMAENQHKINYDSQGHFEFKHLNPAAVMQQVDNVFNSTTSYRIRQVSLQPRLAENRPDGFEREQLLLFRRDKNRRESWGEVTVNGQRYFRYMIPLYVEASCLQCHGEPKGELDISGHRKEGYRVGDVAGALSISIPMERAEANLRASLGERLLLTFLILLLTAGTLTYNTRRFISRPIARLVHYTQEIARGNLEVGATSEKSIGEIEELMNRFTEMARRLQEMYENLENKVAERTAELAAANRELMRINRYKTEFLASMSHELRTPLTAILAFTEELLSKHMGQLTIEQEEYLREIEESGRQLLQLINDLLDMAKIEAGRMSLNLTEVDVGDVVREVERLLRPLAQQKDIAVSLRLLATNRVIADKEKVHQVVRNLLGNAIKFTPPGGKVEITTENTDRPEAGVLLKVKDSGPGIPEEERERIFEVFYQGEKGRSKKYGGTGLGLALVKKIVELHTGTVTVESSLGQGSLFTVFLPLYPAYDEELE